MTNFKKALLTTALISSVPMTYADSESSYSVTGNVTATTNYIWRGISQTKNDGAIQGGFDIEHDSGLYAGFWGSNVDFDSETSVEFDYYAGYAFTLADTVDVDLGVVHYTYPDESDLNFEEAYISFSTAGFTLGYAGTGSFGAYDSTDYWHAGYDYEFDCGTALSLTYGYWDAKDMYTFGEEDAYSDWSVTVSKTFADVDVALAYTDTNLSDDDCESFAGDKDYCDSNFTLSLSKSL